MKNTVPGKNRSVRILSLTFWILSGWGWVMPAPAFAYIDPGLGSMLWQIILSGIFGALFFFEKTRQWVLSKWNGFLKFLSHRRSR